MRSTRRLAAVSLVGIGFVWFVAMSLTYSTSAAPTGVASTETAFWAGDYRSYLSATVRLREEGSLYQQELLVGQFRPGPFGLYYYPPPLGVTLLPLSGMAVSDSSWLWYGLHLAALVAACAILPVRPQIRVLTLGVALLSFPILKDSTMGNVSVLLLLPTAVAWRWLDRPMGSIGQAVAMAVRPTLGVLLILQALRRQWRPVVWTIGAGLVIVLLTLPVVGVHSYADYLAVLRNMSDVSGVRNNHDLGSVVATWGLGAELAALALMAGYAFAIAAMLLSLRRDREVSFMVTLAGSLLLVPLLWDHHLAMLLLPAAFLAERGRRWGLLLPLASWLPAVFGDLAFLYPTIVVVATVLPFTLGGRGAVKAAVGRISPSPMPNSAMAS